MNVLRFHPFAVLEIAEVEDHYRGISDELGDRFMDEADAAIDRLSAFPDSHPRIAGRYRWVQLKKFPYLIIYRRISTDAYKIVAFVHARRRPGYWRGRN